MGVQVRKRRDDPTGAWWVFISHRGRRRAKRVGDKKAAVVAASQLRARLTLGDLSVFDQPSVPVPSFEQVARRWLVEYPALHPIRPATLSNYRQFIEGHLIPFFGAKPISELTASQIEQFITAKRQPGGSIRNPARPLQDRAIQVGLVCPDPEWCRHIDHPRVRHDVMLERRPRRARLGCGPGDDSPGEAARDCRTA